jgi:hypothetical protein
MAAPLGFKDFTTGEVLTAADVDGYLMQGIWVFASAAARDAAVTSPQEGNFAFLKDTNVTTYYTGSAWANLDTTGMVNPMTTTGDTIYSSSGSTPARLGIGTTGQVLTVAGGIPSWATPTTASFVGVSLVKSAVQAVANATDTAITWNTEDYDTSAFHDNSTNTDRITIPAGKGGYYLVEARVSFAGNATGVRSVTLRKNGSTSVIGVDMNNQTAGASAVCVLSRTISAAVADYFHLNAYQTSGGSLNTDNSGGYTFFTMTYLGA